MNKLAPELILHITSFCKTKDVVNLALTNKYIYSIFKNNKKKIMIQSILNSAQVSLNTMFHASSIGLYPHPFFNYEDEFYYMEDDDLCKLLTKDTAHITDVSGTPLLTFVVSKLYPQYIIDKVIAFDTMYDVNTYNNYNVLHSFIFDYCHCMNYDITPVKFNTMLNYLIKKGGNKLLRMKNSSNETPYDLAKYYLGTISKTQLKSLRPIFYFKKKSKQTEKQLEK